MTSSMERTPRVGDIVMYVLSCIGDAKDCKHETLTDRAALINDIGENGRVNLTVFHSVSVAMLTDVPFGGPGQRFTWYWRD